MSDESDFRPSASSNQGTGRAAGEGPWLDPNAHRALDEIYYEKAPDGRPRSLTRFRDYGGQPRRAQAAADNPKETERGLKKVLAERSEETIAPVELTPSVDNQWRWRQHRDTRNGCHLGLAAGRWPTDSSFRRALGEGRHGKGSCRTLGASSRHVRAT